MRSIGKRNTDKLKQIVREEKAKGIPGVRDRILDRIPESWFEIWESAHDEIYMIVEDEIMKGD
jgi:hypothetical protein